jgi:hypothetical protein
MSNKTKRIGFRVTEAQYGWLVDNGVHISNFFGEILDREIMSNKSGFVPPVYKSDSENVEQPINSIEKTGVEQGVGDSRNGVEQKIDEMYAGLTKDIPEVDEEGLRKAFKKKPLVDLELIERLKKKREAVTIGGRDYDLRDDAENDVFRS